MNRWVYIFLGVVFFLGLVFLRKYFILQTTGNATVAPSESQSSGDGGSRASNTSLPSFGNSLQGKSQLSQSQNSFPAAVSNSAPEPASSTDPTIEQHTLSSGGRDDVVQIGSIAVSQLSAYTGDDITFTVTIENTASYKKFVRQLCWESNEGNFGCTPGFNLDPGQVFSLSNNGRFESSGIKSVWVTWTQDNSNFYTPVNSKRAAVTIL